MLRPFRKALLISNNEEGRCQDFSFLLGGFFAGFFLFGKSSLEKLQPTLIGSIDAVKATVSLSDKNYCTCWEEDPVSLQTFHLFPLCPKSFFQGEVWNGICPHQSLLSRYWIFGWCVVGLHRSILLPWHQQLWCILPENWSWRCISFQHHLIHEAQKGLPDIFLQGWNIFKIFKTKKQNKTKKQQQKMNALYDKLR